MSNKAYTNVKIVTDGTIIEDSVLLVSANKISAILKDYTSIPDVEIVDLQGAYLCPGFVDLQVMGAGGALFGSNPNVQALSKMEEHLIKEGVIVFLPTVSTNADNVIDEAIKSAVQYRKSGASNFFGLHIEGPFINPANRGAHPNEFIRKAKVKELENWFDKAQGEIKMLTIAPELQSLEVLNWLEKNNIVTSMGHTGANYNETRQFLSGKRKAVTHLYNGMPGLHHRNPGPIAAIFESKPFTSIVADGVHVDFAMVALAKRNLHDSLYLISDAATPCENGVYKHTERDDRYITLDEISGDEVLSGSKLTMLKAIENCVKYVDIPLAEAVNMATLYPAQVLGIANDFGSIKPGRIASFVIFNKNFEILEVVYNGISIKLQDNKI
ncbi:N-acetylglucosamine-6-phosphate deacetylase [Flavobacterium sp. HTF]|uniref:N-acetylglucosamine-6-phosphate deacetylase n=1 Tax=Flavobacterium sp. HTF TaxID=2170732 RepID=UPI000D5E17D0|nr:N-acetylglucosamine-6-phosphate deacetylase [Flavobacterium sp. HTF]PWB24106.1 N-acetylglucosamine-6-phosphate deacetylase [Flavobacterium sp. HTF]